MVSVVAPPVTIGLPVYNGEHYLPEALDSILDQSFADFELIISDNGSTDSTEQICREAAERDERVNYHRVPQNRGAAWNFSVVARRARSELFRFASHDDVLDRRLLERCLQASKDDPDAVLWYPRTLEIDADGRVLREFTDSLALGQPDASERLRTLLTNYATSNPLFGLIRTRQLQATRLMEDFASSDVVLLAELALRGRFVEIDEALFCRRWELRSAPGERTDADVDLWFNPHSRRKHHFKRTRLIREIGRSILRAPLPAPEKARCEAVLASVWGPRYSRVVLGEFKRAGLATLSRVGSQP